MLGTTTYTVFNAELGSNPIKWHFAQAAYSGKNYIWVEKITLTDAPISCYGTKGVFFNSGFLTNKPLEYTIQVFPDLIEDSRFSMMPELDTFEYTYATYCSISKALEGLIPIADFKRKYG